MTLFATNSTNATNAINAFNATNATNGLGFMKKIVFLLFALSFNFACLAQTPTLAPSQTLSLKGLQDSVTVKRDGRGISYIEAKNDADLYFAQGFVTASDRLWQLDLLRRVARGELSEIFGKQVLEQDKRWRKLGFAQIAPETLKNLPPEVRASLESYASGVNAYIATLKDEELPPEFKILQYKPQTWKAEDSIIIGKILSDALSNTWQNDLRRVKLNGLPQQKRDELLKSTTPDDVILVGASLKSKVKGQKFKNLSSKFGEVDFAKLARMAETRRLSLERIGLYAEDLAASNNWVISGKRTADGKPILANDPHLQPGTPSIWHVVNLSSPNVRVAGVTFPGSPGVVLGHNNEIAWGATNVGPDVQDLYLEQLDANNRYQTPTGLQTAIVRREVIKVRANPLETDTVDEILDVVETRNGVIYYEDNGKKYALKWTARDPKNNELETFYYINRAKDWNSFQSALKTYGGSMQNFVYADARGNIGWYAAGKLPIRKTGDGSTPYDGAKTDGDWLGFVPFEELPHLYNPENGLIVTANQKIVGEDYKYQQIVRDFAPPYRARRIFDLLSAKQKITVDDVKKVQHDVYNIAVARFAKDVVNQKAASPETSTLLTAWDGMMNADSKAALVAFEMRAVFSQKIADANLPTELRSRFAANQSSSFLDWLTTTKPKNWLPKEFSSYADLLKSCETDAKANLTQKLGADESKWVWGNSNKINFPHPLANVPLIGAQFQISPLPLNGSGGSVNVGAGVSMRFIATPANWDATRQTIALGESGLPSSKHFRDQLDGWYSGDTPIFPFTLRAVNVAAKEIVLMNPVK
ncbi:MAG: penicillin acylase family protein [Pyrinomonadaceae bacterium]|nr:penicillin acylase family protein [Pyrinomonadaceae bacterium]